jgi:hypothetical protein
LCQARYPEDWILEVYIGNDNDNDMKELFDKDGNWKSSHGDGVFIHTITLKFIMVWFEHPSLKITGCNCACSITRGSVITWKMGTSSL